MERVELVVGDYLIKNVKYIALSMIDVVCVYFGLLPACFNRIIINVVYHLISNRLVFLRITNIGQLLLIVSTLTSTTKGHILHYTRLRILLNK